MASIDDLLRRADEEGVKMLGIAPAVLPHRGIGVVATRELAQGDVIMEIPFQAIRSLHTIPKEVSGKLSQDMSIHGLLAAELALHGSDRAEWASLVPQWKDFEETVPMLWPQELQHLLPAEAGRLLKQQCARFEADWTAFRKGFTHVHRRDYMYAWLLTNTRSFYFETPSMLEYPWHDRLALLPMADLFNHADAGCGVSFSTEGYKITAERQYQTGEELCTSYGEHTNDFLLAEYGFLLHENRWDGLCLNDLLLPRLSTRQKADLEDRGYLGDFIIHQGSKKNNKVWVALRLISCKHAEWQSYDDEEEDKEGTLSKAAKLLGILLQEYLGIIRNALATLRTLAVGKACQKNALLRRWEQIEVIANQLTTSPPVAEYPLALGRDPRSLLVTKGIFP